MSTIFIRTVLIYIILIAAMRVMGKRQVGQLEVSELVTTFLLSELASFTITDDGIPLLFSVIPILTLLSLEVVGSFTVNKSPLLKKLFIGHPTILIRKGKIIEAELLRNRISIEELLSQLRLKNVTAVDDVEYAILEQNGQLSVIPKADKLPATPSDLKLTVSEVGIAHAVVIDGTVNEENLRLSGRDRVWLEQYLKCEGIACSKVFLLTVDDAGNILLTKKSKDRRKDIPNVTATRNGGNRS